MRMKGRILAAAAVLLLGTVAFAFTPVGQKYVVRAIPMAGMVVNAVRSMANPPGTYAVESNPAVTPATGEPGAPANLPVGQADWPSFNNALEGARFSPLAQIDAETVAQLKVVCEYDTGLFSSFQSGLLMVDGAIIGTTSNDIFSIDAATCRENWRVKENASLSSPLMQGVNRGASFMDGRLFKGGPGGFVMAYDARTGQRLWATEIAEPGRGESVPAAPIAWNGLVFVGNAGGDVKGVKGRMYALDAATGKIVWEFYLVPRGAADVPRGPIAALPAGLDHGWGNGPNVPISGGATWASYTLDRETGILYVPGGNPAPDFAAHLRPGENLFAGSVVAIDARTGRYLKHYKVVLTDWHDWDVSNAPVIVRIDGRKILVVTPKDGFAYGFDLETDRMLFREPVNRIENADAPFSTTNPTRFCPGSQGGAEWNGPAVHAGVGLAYSGQVDWCTTVTVQGDRELLETADGSTWAGMASLNPYKTYGEFDPHGAWGGWLYAFGPADGRWRWRGRTNYPILGGVTATAGGLVFFGDMGANLYAVDARTGEKRWSTTVPGAVGGGIISYAVSGRQRIAVANGMTAILWPTAAARARITVFGLP